MRSSDRLAVSGARVQDLALLGLLAACAMLTQRLLQPQAATTLSLLACAALGAPLAHLARSAASERLRACCWMLLAGSLGMFSGLALDHPLGLLPYLSLCRAREAGLLGGLRDSLTEMPLACAAMIAACQGGEWMRQHLQSATRGTAACRRLPGIMRTSLAMLAGMAAAHALALRLGSGLPAPWLGAGLLLAMLIGMGAGLAIVFRSVRPGAGN